MTETTWFWIGTLGMLAGSVVLMLAGGRRTQDEEGHTLAHGLVPLFAAIAYFAMAVHQGSVTLAAIANSYSLAILIGASRRRSCCSRCP